MSTRSPREIERHLRDRIVGQDAACRSLAVAVANHYRRLAYRGPTPLEKANVLLLGPTGCGKTAMVRVLAEALEVPFASVAATGITEAGFVGLDPEFVLERLVDAAGGDHATAGRGIAYVDEVDKIARRASDETERGKHPTGVGVQQSLLDILDARVVHLGPQGEVPFDASGVLFVLSGTFVGIERQVARRMASRSARPISLTQNEALARLEPADLVGYGLIPEFVGRLSALIPLRQLTELDVFRILTEPAGSPLRQAQAVCEAAGARLEVAPEWLYQVAREATARGTGARGLRSALDAALEAVFYEVGAGDVVRIGADGTPRRVQASEVSA